jgi:Lon protease-like protein
MTQELAVFPLGTAFLPGDNVSLNVFETRYLDMLTHVMSTGRQFVSVLIARGSEVGGKDQRLQHGVIISIEKISPLEHSLLLEGTALAVVDIISWLQDDPYPRAICQQQHAEPLTNTECIKVAKSLSLTAQRLRTLLEKVTKPASVPPYGSIVQNAIASIASGRWWDEQVTPATLEEVMWLLARCVPCGPLDRYDLLRDITLVSRVQLLDRIIEHVSEMVEFQSGE